MTPLRIAKNRTQKRRRRRRKSYKSSLLKKKSRVVPIDVVPIQRVAKFDPNLFYRLNRGSGSNLADWYHGVPLHLHKDKDFLYDPKHIETKYTHSNVRKIHKFLNVSDFI